MPVPTTIREKVRDRVAYIDVAGDIDFTVKATLENQVAVQIAAGHVSRVIIDITAVLFIDSAGIGALVVCRRLADDTAKTLSVIGAQGRVADTLNLTGVRQWLANETDPTPTTADAA